MAVRYGVPIGFAVLFFGGMLIFPISSFILKNFLGRGKISPENPGGLTVIETLFPMISGFLAAWLMMPHRPEFVFAMAAIAVGTHYFGFRTAYGDWTNWILGAAMSVVGIAAIFFGIPASSLVPFIIAGIEMAFGIWFIRISLANDND